MRKQKWVSRVSVALAIVALSALLATTGRAAPGLAYTYEFIPGPAYTQDDVKALLRVATADVYALPLTDVEWRDPQGNIAQCRPSSGGCVIRNQYSSNGSLIASTHEFYIAGEHRKPGVYLAIVKYCYPDPYIRLCVGGWREMFRANFTISSAQGAYQNHLPLLINATSPYTVTLRR